jgi:hypothetical protein
MASGEGGNDLLAVLGAFCLGAVYYWTNNDYAPWAFMLAAGLVGECTDAILRRMEAILKDSKQVAEQTRGTDFSLESTQLQTPPHQKYSSGNPRS